MKITVYQYDFSHDIIDRFTGNLLDRELKYLASEMVSKGVMELSEIEQAVNRSVRICNAGGLPVQAHFKPVYVSSKGQVYYDCRLSTLGRQLVLLNGPPSNRAVARVQLQFLGKTEYQAQF